MCVFCVYVCLYLHSLSVKMIDSQLLEKHDKTYFSLLPSLSSSFFCLYFSVSFHSPLPFPRRHNSYVVHDLISARTAAPVLANVVYHVVKLLKIQCGGFITCCEDKEGTDIRRGSSAAIGILWSCALHVPEPWVSLRPNSFLSCVSRSRSKYCNITIYLKDPFCCQPLLLSLFIAMPALPG